MLDYSSWICVAPRPLGQRLRDGICILRSRRAVIAITSSGHFSVIQMFCALTSA